MSKLPRPLLFLLILLATPCAESQHRLSPDVLGFISLLAQERQPTLAEFSRFSGECGGEAELAFVLNECQSRGWPASSDSCIAFSRQRCELATQKPSLLLSWLRTTYHTVGKRYRVISIKSESESIEELEVQIGENRFVLFHDSSSAPVGGLVVGVSSINGRKVGDRMPRPTGKDGATRGAG